MSNSKKYVVFDRDEHKKDELIKCQKLAEKNGITILFSSIDFEIWILMHFGKVLENNNYSRKDLVEKLSGKDYFNQDYLKFKGNDYREFLYDKVQNAFNNASKLYKNHYNFLNDDPFTNIHRYLKEIYQTDKF